MNSKLILHAYLLAISLSVHPLNYLWWL